MVGEGSSLGLEGWDSSLGLTVLGGWVLIGVMGGVVSRVFGVSFFGLLVVFSVVWAILGDCWSFRLSSSDQDESSWLDCLFFCL